ncbi:MAG: DegT/DnrJ/EryC1/StrS family aminotransferase [Acidobacteria bacterium]|nr:DegT/DnrJ/EryC1/StrS family aminotransferase [Acidobacteriota bacterium]MBA3884226.1 DegT/DnrJ/EryC1/StrS family aminotransferase [Acidobacteriota bacterium]
MNADRLAVLGGTPAVTSPAPRWPDFDERDRRALIDVLESGVWGGYHEAVGELEGRLAAAHEARYGIATSNGTVSLEIALTAAGVGPGDEVIVPPVSFVASATAIARIGAVPVFADVEPETITLDPARATAALTPRTRAIMLVHFAGCPADLDRFVPLCTEHNLALIEDCAHAPGASWRGRPVGSFGAFGSFSFQASKNLTAGEGGMLVTNDPDLAESARSIMNQGRRSGGAWYEHVRLGTNARLTGFQGALLLVQLDRLPGQNRKRADAADRLRSALRDLTGFTPHPPVGDPRVTGHAWHIFSMRYDASAYQNVPRERAIDALATEGVPVSAGYPHPLYRNPLFADHPHRVEPCPVAEAYCREAIWLPHHALLGTPRWIDGVVGAFRKVSVGIGALREVRSAREGT